MNSLEVKVDHITTDVTSTFQMILNETVVYEEMELLMNTGEIDLHSAIHNFESFTNLTVLITSDI